MKPEFLTQSDQILSACGRPAMSQANAWVDIPYGIPYNRFALGSVSVGPVFNDEIIVDTPVPFLLKAIQIWVPLGIEGNVNWRLRFPNGHFWNSNNSSGPFASGSFRYVFQQPVECNPRSKIWVTLDGQTDQWFNAGGMSAVFEGCLRFPLRGNPCGQSVTLEQAELALPRYRQDRNCNILAPEWRLGNQCYPETPRGYRDEAFTYAGYLSNLIPVPWTGQVVANQQLPFESLCDFVIRWFGFADVSTTGGAAGNLAVRIFDDTGYEMTAGFTPLGFGSFPLFPEFWVKGENKTPALFIDYQILDGSGAGGGVINVQPIFGGVKRRRVYQ